MQRTKGDLCGFGIRSEDEYGKVSDGTTAFGGNLRTLSIPRTVNVENDVGACGNRVDGTPYVVAKGFAYTAEFTFPEESGNTWTEWAEAALGSLQGMQRELPSHTAVFHIASDQEEICVGSVVNSLKISAGGIGQVLVFTVGCTCQSAVIGKGGQFSNVPGNGTVSMPVPARIAGPPLTFRGGGYPVMRKTSDGDASDIRCKSWTLSVATELTEDPGLVDGIPLTAGMGIVPGDTSVTLEITVTSAGPEWDLLRDEFPIDMVFEVPVGTKKVRLTGCRFDPQAPSRSAEGSYDETLSVIARNMTVV